MKSLFLLISIVTVTVFYSMNTLAQDSTEDLQIEIKVTNNTETGVTDGSIIVECFGNAPYSYMLYNKPPWREGEIIKEELEVNKDIIRISNLEPGEYYIMIQDADKRIVAKTIKIE